MRCATGSRKLQAIAESVEGSALVLGLHKAPSAALQLFAIRCQADRRRIGSLDICEQLIRTPDKDFISTSYVERQNLTMRMSMRRFTRLTNAFSKKLENLKAAVALHFAHYNFVRIHKTLRVTPAMAAGVTDRLWSMHELLDELHAQALILAP
jgi:hypothetical protein